ncbi:hypothetical protein F511_27533, partial [Dorcoceras hygrometricum]
NLVQGDMRVAEYARQFSALLAYVLHVVGHERVKRNMFLEGLNEDLYFLVLASSPVIYTDAVDKAIDTKQGLLNLRFRVQPQATQSVRPGSQGVHSSQPPQATQQSLMHPISLFILGSVPKADSLRGVQVLVLRALVALSLVAPELLSVVSVEESIRLRNASEIRVLATSAGSMDTLLECVL